MMNSVVLLFVALLAWSAPARSESPLPFENETLHYTVNWPSNLSLGEGEMRATKVSGTEGSSDRWEFDLTLDAAVPGFSASDKYHSVATSDLCSVQFEKEFVHGKRKAEERITFDQEKGTATRQTLGGGGKSEISTPTCAKDALAFLYSVRRELERGRVPPPQKVFFGGAYDIRLEYSGRQTLRLHDRMIDTDRMVASVKGQASDITFEVFFAVEAGRRPVMIRVPLPLGTFSMQLVQ